MYGVSPCAGGGFSPAGWDNAGAKNHALKAVEARLVAVSEEYYICPCPQSGHIQKLIWQSFAEQRSKGIQSEAGILFVIAAVLLIAGICGRERCFF